MEGDPDILRIEGYLGRLLELLRRRSTCQDSIRELLSAPWIRSTVQSGRRRSSQRAE
jgi:hypothetical protein